MFTKEQYDTIQEAFQRDTNLREAFKSAIEQRVAEIERVLPAACEHEVTTGSRDSLLAVVKLMNEKELLNRIFVGLL